MGLAADELAAAARIAGPGSGTGDGPGGAGPAAAWAACSAPSTAAAGGVHELAGAARSGSWLRIAVCRSTSSGVGSRPSSSASTRTRLGVGPQGVGLTARAVEGDHEAAGEPLAQRVLVDHPLELGHRLGVATERQQGVEASFERLQAQLVPAHRRRSRPVLVRHLGEHRAVPLGESGLEVGEGAGGIAGEGGAGFGDLVFEAVHVEQAAGHGEHVARPLAPQQAGVAERSAQQ